DHRGASQRIAGPERGPLEEPGPMALAAPPEHEHDVLLVPECSLRPAVAPLQTRPLKRRAAPDGEHPKVDQLDRSVEATRVLTFVLGAERLGDGRRPALGP